MAAQSKTFSRRGPQKPFHVYRYDIELAYQELTSPTIRLGLLELWAMIPRRGGMINPELMSGDARSALGLIAIKKGYRYAPRIKTNRLNHVC